ncbi:50S ribosomal protein L10 [bacterium]|nr:50S ribosomal protein L10 [bacterium]
MATTKAKKSQVMDEIREVLKEKKNVILTEYRGLNVEQVTQLRNVLRKAGMTYKVLKNTLSRKLFEEAGITELADQLVGPVAVSFLSEDVAASSKALIDYAKKNELLVIKVGYVDGKLVDLEGIKAIAALPSREILLGMVLATMQAPVKDLLSVLQGNTRKLIYALNAIKEQKEKEAA